MCRTECTSTSIVAMLILGGDDKAARAVLQDLHAVLYTQDNQVFWYHASFPDFILDQAHSNFCFSEKDFVFSCNEAAHHNLLGKSCFHVIEMEPSGLRFNIGNITLSFLFDHDNAVVLTEQVNKNISAVLRYSCHHWTHHLPSPDLAHTKNLCDYISKFMSCSGLRL